MYKENDLPFCKCGCGNRVSKPNNKYINGHSRKGKRLSKETIEKLKNREFSYETRKKMSESHKNKKLSQETKDKISNSQKGSNNGFFNKSHDEKSKNKMRNA